MGLFNFYKHKRKPRDWPKTPEGSDVPSAFLLRPAGGALETEMTVNLLGAYGIPAVCEYPPGGVDICVPETLLEDARNILSADIVRDGEEEEQ
jgi:hypothetical protein